ncbi:hypothetical protein T439DRAFT_325449 [Meredithblackwellia eburnea MCA 4105]
MSSVPTRLINVSHEVIGGEWDTISAEVLRQLPLRNLHWRSRSTNRPGIKTIQSLNVNFKPLASFDHKTQLTLLERPYLHLLFVLCDDNEVYRATIRSQIREWLDGIIARPNQEWLIVHVSSGRSASSKFYQRKGSVVDKIKADFNTGKKDRCVQVAQAASADDPTAWADFLIKMKEGVITTFDINVGLYEEDVRRADSQRQLEGWQYTTFFSQKEGLADCFETMNLLEEALIQYDELEASFFQSLKENHTAWFGKIGGLDPGDDALPLLSTENKPYRQLIALNSVTIFDFRIYLFARQADILFQLGRIAEVAKRGAFFISQFTRTLRENQATLGPNFLESWTYSACLNIADECTRRAAHSSVDKLTSDNFNAVRAELLDLARKQLDKIGIVAGHLPLEHPFSMSLNEITSDRPSNALPSNRDAVSRLDLLGAIGNQEQFDKLYIDLTNRAIQAYQSSARKRCSLKLHASLAALEDHRKHYSSAQKLYAPLPAHYVDTRWVKIESSLVARCSRLQESLDMPRDRLLSTLSLIRAGVEFESKDWNLDIPPSTVPAADLSKGERMKELAAELMQTVYKLSGLLSKDFAAIAFPIFSMKLASNRGEAAVDEDGMTIDLAITCLLPCPLKIDEARLKLSTVDGEVVWFTSETCNLSPGVTHVTLFCPTAMSGRLALELSQIRFSRIIFQYSHRPVSNRNLAPDPRNLPLTAQQPIIHFPRDPQALNVYTELPKIISLDQGRKAVFCIATGRNDLVKVALRIAVSPSDAFVDPLGARIIEGTATLTPTADEGSLVVENVSSSSVVKIEVPVGGNLSEPILEFSVVAEYYTSKRPTTRRVIRRMFEFPIALPLGVKVKEFFRKDCLFTLFEVSTGGVQALKIKTAELEAGDGVTVKPCRNSNAPTLSVFPLQDANFLFKVKTSRPDASRSLRLSFTYCSVDDEFLVKVKNAITATIVEDTPRDDWHWFEEGVTAEAHQATNMHQYGLNGTLSHLRFEPSAWQERVEEQFSSRPAQQSALLLLARIYERLANAPKAEDPDAWKTLTIPMQLPSVTIHNLVRLTPAVRRTEVGRPLAVEVSIRPMFNWSESPISEPIVLTYEVTGTFDDWLVSGRRRGEFVAEKDTETKVTLTLIPLRPGHLFLPSIAVNPAVFAGHINTGAQQETGGITVDVLPLVSRTAYTVDIPVHYVEPV